MRARDVLPDRQVRLGAPGSGAADRGRGPHRRPSHLAAPQPDADRSRARRRRKSTSGIAADEMALHGIATSDPEHAVLSLSRSSRARRRRSICCSRAASSVFGADIWASDWNPMTPKAQLKLLIDRLKAAGRGIILFHDPKAADRGHAAGFPALSPGQPLSRGSCGAGVAQPARPQRNALNLKSCGED